MAHFITSFLCLILCFSLIQSGDISSSSGHHLCHRDEALALLQFKEMLDVNSSLASFYCNHSYPKMLFWNKPSADCCKWDGITCDEITGQVIALDLSCSRLMGVIVHNSTLFHLSRLQKLNLASNYFYGEISPNFGRLTSLTHLNLSSTDFQGLIPPKLSHLSKLVSLDFSFEHGLRISPHDFHLLLQNLTHIRVLSLDSVDISTTLPANWSSSLTYLHLGNTGVNGKLSSSIFHLPRLQTLILYGNENLTVGFLKSNYSINPSLWMLDLSYTNCLSDGIPDLIGSLASLKSLSLPGCQLSGSFPNSIGNLSQIVQLDLENNNFNGSIPLIISNLLKLRELYLGYNSFTGQFPSGIGNLTELTILELESNLLSGPLPSNISGLRKLRYINLQNNGFDGAIPSWIFSIPSLTYLLLRNNYFTGQIKEFEGRSLEYVDFSNNKLNGPIPNSISILLNLKTLDLSSNDLSGSIELTMFSNLQKLSVLFLSNNKLSLKIDNDIHISVPELSWLGLSSFEITEFPYFLMKLNNLEYLELSNNKLHGQIPNWIPWHSLGYLNLSHNSLSSLGPVDIVPLVKNLVVLDLRSNQFQEPLPPSICSMELLYILDLSYNSFTGTIPQCFGNFSSALVVLNLAKNNLKGAISMTFPKDNWLGSLNLNGNLLEGPLPRSLANCKHLEVLDLGNNVIHDTFPSFLENLKELQVLILKSNRFAGSLSNLKSENFLPKLRIFDLSCIEFVGVLPLKLLKSFKAMTNLDKIKPKASYMGKYEKYMNQPHFYDSMTFVMKGYEVEFTRILTTLVVIDLSSNNFTGDIPEVIGNLNSLIQLNLSHNKFSGHIPSALGELKVLESLDLSWNQIEGEIPWQLAELTSLERLNLSQNCLVGRIPQGKQFNTFLNDSYYGNLGLCGFPVTKTCGEIDLPLPPSQRSFQGDENSSFLSGFTLKSVFIGYGLGFLIGCLVFFTDKPKWLVSNVEELCWYGFLWFGKKEIYKQLKMKSRRRHSKPNRRNN